MEGTVTSSIFLEIVDFFKSHPDLIVPLLSILGTIFVVFYTVSVILTRVHNYDKIRGLRGHSTKILDHELAAYLIVFFFFFFIAGYFREKIDILCHLSIMTVSFLIVYIALRIKGNDVGIVVVAWIFIVFGAVSGFYFTENDWIFYFTILGFLLYSAFCYWVIFMDGADELEGWKSFFISHSAIKCGWVRARQSFSGGWAISRSTVTERVCVAAVIDPSLRANFRGRRTAPPRSRPSGWSSRSAG